MLQWFGFLSGALTAFAASSVDVIRLPRTSHAAESFSQRALRRVTVATGAFMVAYQIGVWLIPPYGFGQIFFGLPNLIISEPISFLPPIMIAVCQLLSETMDSLTHSVEKMDKADDVLRLHVQMRKFVEEVQSAWGLPVGTYCLAGVGYFCQWLYRFYAKIPRSSDLSLIASELAATAFGSFEFLLLLSHITSQAWQRAFPRWRC